MWEIVLVECFRCKSVFGCNYRLVPSILMEGMRSREPICESCHTILNKMRISLGLVPWPEPLKGAYEPVNLDSDFDFEPIGE